MEWRCTAGRVGALALGVVALGCSGDSSGPAPVPIPTTVTISGNNQSGMIGTRLAQPVGVTVLDQSGSPMKGVVVSFVVSAGGGVVAATGTTNALGAATAAWILGNTVGSGNNTVTGTIPGYAGPAPSFTASATPIVSAYNIDLRFLTPMTPTQAVAFTSAAARWSSIIVGDLPSDRVIAAPGDCFANSPAQDEVIDDIVIFASLDSIDGPGQILGGASPCWIRDVGSLTIVGGMVFDSADMALLQAQDILDAVILHEMGHVLGIGSLWTIVAPSLLVGEGTLNPYFNGANGVFRFGLSGGGVYPGTPVPVENQGGAGTRDVHWRETVMGRELMTGYISLVSNPLSTITIGSLADLAYTVSYANADPYTVSPVNVRMPGGAAPIHLLELPSRVTIKSVDLQGRITRVR